MMSSCLALLVLALFSQAEAREKHSIGGAFYIGQAMTLFSSDFKVLSASAAGHNTVTTQDMYGVPQNFEVTAATATPLMFFFDFTFFGVNKIYHSGRVLTYPDDAGQESENYPDFVWQGIDGAAIGGNMQYYFKGCDYITRNSGTWDPTPRPMSELELPCDVDAAWYDGTNFVALKGNQVWIEGRGVDLPEPLDDYFFQDAWEIGA